MAKHTELFFVVRFWSKSIFLGEAELFLASLLLYTFISVTVSWVNLAVYVILPPSSVPNTSTKTYGSQLGAFCL